VLTAGLAPAEIASVATTSLAGADTAIAAGMLVGSTLVTVTFAGITLQLLGGGAAIHPAALLTNLALIVGAPMAAGITIRSRLTLTNTKKAWPNGSVSPSSPCSSGSPPPKYGCPTPTSPSRRPC